jgi:hypothetical protein
LYSEYGLRHKVVADFGYTPRAMIRPLIIGILGLAALAACAGTPPPHPARNASALPPGSVGRTYSGRQLRETGRTDAAHALGMLDPDVTVHGN